MFYLFFICEAILGGQKGVLNKMYYYYYHYYYNYYFYYFGSIGMLVIVLGGRIWGCGSVMNIAII